ncbi:MAG TPA: NADH-quinone oxidoreductase subunit M [Thauera aminoaromatica]|jgi:NADH-quinone oxidoreductase subunit M|uniref:NADH-quinone oxidoreductase subunit M n=1 Tax=Thauera aminoaromatica TaxID=164330 RepID=C4ZKI9_THASP|nr:MULTISPECIES: NADH-quinone oxidoreductase subunit M [Thauera]MDA0233850.1 NADH-quinone oxidoreductase subunit M [Pseudomonadota bacterium]ACK54506.1 proton-translocating NADH-quinone oxidoreductase, chain M [Thauera aminoaromatica]KIN89642.1 proton-translocating NADH-quinone oxidoreductase, chain M family protein [Thauera sp. SWB20]TXH83693.1 MAG: NADH-quinone oxidoreductase subunit M [Thauera aminoaromatica]HMV91857.1 NADH-quinone oxidoreductase subunit M [Thauera aminoaromatica]
MTDIPLLSLAIWVPIIGGLLVLATGSDRNAPLARMLALAVAVAGFVVTIPLYTGFDVGTSAMQFVELQSWVPRFNINYHLGVDGISVLFVLLNAFITIIVVAAGWQVIQTKVAQYMAAFLIMSGLMNGIFSALDAVLFYVFFEASLIPLYLIIGIWGGANRVYAAIKFFLYTLFGSLLMLIALLYLFMQSGGSFSILDWHQLPLPIEPQILIFLAFLIAFGVKVPMWPVHTWLPDAHVEAPTGGSVVLAAIALKLGAYGFLRFSLPIVPDAANELAPLVITLSLIAVVYIGFVALVQADMKKLVAYSSISHMGFVTLGFFMFNSLGVEGALVQMISHGFVSGAMFLCIGVLYDRLHSRQIADYGGVVHTMPKFAAFFMLFTMANSGLPATSGFVGEFMVVLGAVQYNFWIGFVAATTLILGAAYSLWMYKRVVFGKVANPHVAELEDINGREFAFLAVLAACVLAMGLYPFPFTEVMHASVNELLRHVAVSKL